jgi:hypothetical protein
MPPPRSWPLPSPPGPVNAAGQPVGRSRLRSCASPRYRSAQRGPRNSEKTSARRQADRRRLRPGRGWRSRTGIRAGAALLLAASVSLASWHAILRSGRRAPLTEGPTPRYVTGGYVVMNRGTDLLAAPFHPARLELGGPLAPVVQNVAAERASTMHYAVSRNGTLAYVTAPTDQALVILQDGEERDVDVGPWAYDRPSRPRFSPDGTRLALTAGHTSDVWIYHLQTRTATRLTFEGGAAPVWTPNGHAVTFAAPPFLGTGPDRRGLHLQPLDGRSGAQRLLALEEWHQPIGWTPDGRMLAFETVRVDGPPSIWALADGNARLVLPGGHSGRLSPDGRWLAYHSEGSGGTEVYVTPFPEADARWQISVGGGSGPAWSPDGTEVVLPQRLPAGRRTDHHCGRSPCDVPARGAGAVRPLVGISVRGLWARSTKTIDTRLPPL